MKETIVETYDALWYLVENDCEEYGIKEIAELFLEAMNDWPTLNQERIVDFIEEFKAYFGEPITIKKIDSFKFNGKNAWHFEAGSLITEMIKLSQKNWNESDFNKIMQRILNYYHN